jgi:hypothetical protein
MHASYFSPGTGLLEIPSLIAREVPSRGKSCLEALAAFGENGPSVMCTCERPHGSVNQTLGKLARERKLAQCGHPAANRRVVAHLDLAICIDGSPALRKFNHSSHADPPRAVIRCEFESCRCRHVCNDARQIIP